MAKTQTKLKQTAADSGKRTNPFELVRDGEPLPAIASQTVRIRVSKRSRRPDVVVAPDSCPLCGGVIARFDAEIFGAFGRCAPCHDALTEA